MYIRFIHTNKYTHSRAYPPILIIIQSSLKVSSVSSKRTFAVSGNASTNNPAKIAVPPHIVVGINHANEPKKSTIYGEEIDPTCAIVELVPMAELRKFVGNNSAVCKITTANTALIQVRPNIATATVASDSSVYTYNIGNKINYL